jgi:hypothetical protein
MANATRAREIEDVPDWGTAVDLAWKQLRRGELLVVQTSSVPRTVRKIQSLVGLEPEDAAEAMAAAG